MVRHGVEQGPTLIVDLRGGAYDAAVRGLIGSEPAQLGWVEDSELERFVACAGADGFFRRCGFEPAADGRPVRTGPARPAAARAVRSVTLAGLESAIRGAWSRETSADPDEWSPDNPARGQCDATAAVVRSYLGGEIVVADVLADGRRVERHAGNRLPGGLTREQFRRGEQLGEPAAREPLLLGDAVERHELLARRVRESLD